MSELLNLKGKNLIKLLVIIFVVFAFIGALVTYITSLKLNKNEPAPIANQEVVSTAPIVMQGTVTFIGENAYPEDKISYSLTDVKGDDIILLRASDQKLSIAQGLFVNVKGRKVKTIDGKKDVLQVMEVTLKNGTN